MRVKKEMQIEVIERVLSNVKNDKYLFDGIQFYNFNLERWEEIRELNYRAFKGRTLRIEE